MTGVITVRTARFTALAAACGLGAALIMAHPAVSFADEDALSAVQRLALERNPRLRAMGAEALMRKNRIESSSSLEDPKLKLALNNVPTDGFSLSKEDMTSKEIGVSQMIPLGGKLGMKREIASREYAKAVLRLQQERSETLHMLRTSCFELDYLRKSVEIMKEIKAQIALLIRSEIAANKTGAGSLTNVIKAETESAMVDEEIIVLTQKERETGERIAYLAGGPVDTAKGLREAVASRRDTPPVENAVEAVLEGNPGLKIAKADAEISSLELGLAKREYVPDVEVGLSYMQRDAGPAGSRSDMVTGMVTLNVPAWFYKRNQPMIGEMREKKAAVDGMLGDYRNDLSARAATVVSQVEKWRALRKLYSERIIPQTELSLETALSRYGTGAREFMPIIDSVRMLLRYRKELIMAEKEYYAGISELAMLMGREIWP